MVAEMLSRDYARKILSNAPEDRAFRCCDGRTIRNIRDLGKTLAHMSDGAYRYHANGYRNDFSAWLKDVIGDDRLARHIGRTTDRRQAVREVADRIAMAVRNLN